MNITGILLAAGRGRRFDPSGASHKLLATLPGGLPVAVASARAMRAALPRVVAVVAAPGELSTLLEREGCEVIVCPDADSGMAASLTHGLRHCQAGAEGWVIGLADMPYVMPSTISALAAALAQADIAVPVMGSRRGNPVAFGKLHAHELLGLSGDQGARALLRSHPVCEVQTEDAGILLDIDQPADMLAAPSNTGQT